jgi:hypothetical protein
VAQAVHDLDSFSGNDTNKLSEDTLRAMHVEGLEIFDEIEDATRPQRKASLSDRRFCDVAGSHWEGKIGRQFRNKPKLEINLVHHGVQRIINEYRRNRITVDFVPRDGSNQDTLSDAADGLFRADAEHHGGPEAFDNGFEEGTKGGCGAWRLRAVYVDPLDDENEEQHIIFEPIFDADQVVFWDLNAKRQDKADAKHCFKLTPMSHRAYKAKYDDDPADWPHEENYLGFDWVHPDYVWIAEYYIIEEQPAKIFIYRHIDGAEESIPAGDFEADELLAKRLKAKGSRKVRERQVKKRKVRKLIMNGDRVLEDCGYIAGSEIPIVPMYGERAMVDHVERWMGHVRPARDANVVKNVETSKLVDLSSFSSREKPIFDTEQVQGHSNFWAEDNIKDYPYLTANALRNPDGTVAHVGPMAYTKPPQVPPALAALLQVADQDVKQMLGNQERGEELRSNVSGKAVELIQTSISMGASIYMDNMAKAMARCGEIWLSMAGDVYVEFGRKVMTLDANRTGRSTLELNRPVLDPKTREVVIENDFSKAKMDVIATVGPTSQTARAATVQALTNLMQMAGAAGQADDLKKLLAVALMNMEGEGLSGVREHYRKMLVEMGVEEPTEDEAKEILEREEAKGTDPQAQWLEASAREADADAANKQAQTALNAAKAVGEKVDTIKALAELGPEDFQAAALAETAQDEILTNSLAATQPPQPGAEGFENVVS